MRLKVYISGPITRGCHIHNFSQAAEAQTQLIKAGFAPMNPMLSMMLPGAWNIPHEDWIEADLPWVACADAVLRLPGESTGAETECRHAIQHNIPVFRAKEYSDYLKTLEEWRDNRPVT